MFVEEVIISAEFPFELGYSQLQKLVPISQLLIPHTLSLRSAVWRPALGEILFLRVGNSVGPFILRKLVLELIVIVSKLLKLYF